MGYLWDRVLGCQVAVTALGLGLKRTCYDFCDILLLVFCYNVRYLCKSSYTYVGMLPTCQKPGFQLTLNV